MRINLIARKCQAIPEGYGTNPHDCACGACEPDTFTGCLFCGCQGHDRPNCPTEHFVAPAPDRDALRDEDYPGIARALDDYGAALLSQALVNSEREADRLAGEAEAALRRTTIR